MHIPEIIIACGMTGNLKGKLSVKHRRQRRATRQHGRLASPAPLDVKIIDPSSRAVDHDARGELYMRVCPVMFGYRCEVEGAAKGRGYRRANGHWRPRHARVVAGLLQGCCPQEGMVIRSGESISPREGEEYLYRIVAAREVEAAGVRSLKYGEELRACVGLKSGCELSSEEVQVFYRDQVAKHKIPSASRGLWRSL